MVVPKTATMTVNISEECGTLGHTIPDNTADHETFATSATATYAKSTRVNHLRYVT